MPSGPVRIYRLDSSAAAAIDGNASDANNPSIVPAFGKKTLSVFMRTPAGAGTLVVTQQLRANSTAGQTDSFTTSGAGGVVRAAVAVTGEVVGVQFQNGATPQRPEVLCVLED